MHAKIRARDFSICESYQRPPWAFTEVSVAGTDEVGLNKR